MCCPCHGEHNALRLTRTLTVSTEKLDKPSENDHQNSEKKTINIDLFTFPNNQILYMPEQ